jgi:hypothetical protein
MSRFDRLRIHACAAFHTFAPTLFVCLFVILGLALLLGWLYLMIEVNILFLFVPLPFVGYFCFREDYKQNVQDCEYVLKQSRR